MDIVFPNESELWAKRLTRKCGHEVGICRWFKDYLNESDVVYDIGAHFGFYPVLISHINRKIEVVAIEPQDFLMNFLRFNSAKGRSQKAWTLVSKMAGSVDSAQMVTMDTLARHTGKWPTIIKMDVDGPEVDVLRGCEEIIKRRKTEFLIEAHPLILEKMGLSIRDVLEQFPSDYKVLYLAQIREQNETWTPNFAEITRDDNPYLYIAPTDHARFDGNFKDSTS